MGTPKIEDHGYCGAQSADGCPSCLHPAEGVDTPLVNKARAWLGMKPAAKRCAVAQDEDAMGACDCRHLWHTVSQL